MLPIGPAGPLMLPIGPAGPLMLPIGPAAAAIPRPPPGPGVPSAPAPAAPPNRGPCMPAPPGCAPAVPPSRLRRLSAISRSIPGRSSRPANRPRKPGLRGACSRSSTCSTTCTVAARPNRAIHAFGITSRFLIVPVASRSAMTATRAFESVSVMVSSPSSWSSSSTATSTVFNVSPGPNVSVPEVAV